jgi:antitoxin Phd
MERMSVMEARRELSRTINRVAFGKERIVLVRRGEEVAALVPVEDLKALRALDDQLDAEEARHRIADPTDEAVPYDEVRRDLGLD